MFRRLFLPCAWFGVALGLVVMAAPITAWSQDRSTGERLDRLERDLNMLQRQVYGGAPPPVAAGGGGGAVDAEVRMERLEDQMRDLTGRVEELMNEINQVRQRLQQVSSDIEVRFSQMSPGAPPTGPSGAVPDGPRPRDPAAYPPPSGDELTPPGGHSRDSGPTSAEPATARTELKAGLPGGSVGAQYNYAFGLLKKADYPAAETALKAFIERHPKNSLAGNAQYWLGETYYARHRYKEAAGAFAEGYKRYPKSTKAADDLLKLGMSLGRANQKDNACVVFGQLGHDFPNAAASVRERASTERRRLGC